MNALNKPEQSNAQHPHHVKTAAAVTAACCSLLLTSGTAWPQSYPVKPIRMLIGFSPGGGADVVARSLTPRLVEALGQQIVVENRPGANGIIAAELVAKALPDGYTLLVAPGNYAFAPAMNPKLPFNMATAFTPVSMFAETPLLLVVHPSLPAKNVKQLIALAKSRRGDLTYASGGVGGSGHLATELFRSLTQVDLVHIPYKGTGAAITDLIGGQVSLCICTLPSVLQHVKSGRMRALAVTTQKRNSAIPEIPTVAEAGVAGYEMSQWYGLLAPAGTPATIIERLNVEISKALTHPETRNRLLAEGAEPVTISPQQFGTFFKTEIDKWTRVVQKAGIRPE